MNTRCKPGDLVMVIKGPDTGKTATILRQATQEELRAAYDSVCDGVKLRDRVVWVLDRNMLCQVVGNTSGKIYGQGMFPFKADENLLPITPPASMHTKEQSKELTHG